MSKYSSLKYWRFAILIGFVLKYRPFYFSFVHNLLAGGVARNFHLLAQSDKTTLLINEVGNGTQLSTR